ncbi:MAG: hypothetical protein ABF261_03265 [Candidatus Arcticimaribacter sp.]
MKKTMLFVVAILFATTTVAQVAMSRTLTIKEGKQAKFMELAAKKTKKFNGKKGQPAYYTFSIETGPDAGNLWRVQVAEEMANFDTVDTEGNQYWMDTVGDMHTSANTQHWWYNGDMSYVSNPQDVNLLSRMIFYTIKANGGEDFWRFRKRVAETMKAANLPFAMNVWNCGSGCNGNVVLVSFSHKGYGDQFKKNTEDFPKMVEKYNELYGEGAYKEDNVALDGSLEMLWGRRIIHMKFLPELSSPPNMNN